MWAIWILIIWWINFAPAVKYRGSTLKCPHSPANCTIFDYSPWRIYETIHTEFNVKGWTVDFSIKDDTKLNIRCDDRRPSSPSIDDTSLPIFNPVLSFESLTIEDCAPPKDTYSSAFKALNITGFTNLTLSNFNHNQESFAAHKFEGLNYVQNLKIRIFFTAYLDLSFLLNVKNLSHLELEGIKISSFPLRNRIRSISLVLCEPLNKMQLWSECHHLERLMVKDWDMYSFVVAVQLPEKWLANCNRLTSLHIEGSIINNLPQLMVNSSSLDSLRVVKCQLKNFTNNVLVNARNLRTLDLSHNSLSYLTRDTFSTMTNLRELILKYNRLVVQSFASFAPLVLLRELILDSNCNKDTCKMSDGDDDTSPWPLLPSLEKLSLENTRATKLCREWTLSMPVLKHLNLTNNLIYKLQYKDIKMIRNNNWDVDLRDNKLEVIIYEENDYMAHLRESTAVNNKSSNTATIWTDSSPRDCNCHWYWFIRVLQDRPGDILIPNLLCDRKIGESKYNLPIAQMPPKSLVCEIKCDHGCYCTRRAHDGTAVAECFSVGFKKIPHIPFLREIHVANNDIKSLSITDFPETLEFLDLRYNRLSKVNEETASVMFNRPNVSYRLAGNPIMCTCDNLPFINALNTHHNQVLDYASVTCNHGQLIEYFTDTQCWIQINPHAISIGLGCIAFVPFIMLLLYYRYQNEIRVLLYSWGWCSCWVNEEELDKDKYFDVFISFAYADSSYVMEELLPGLEEEPNSFAVCVHYRDWMPGEWIPTQIAESVENSRRTVIVLSKNFLSSVWSLLEFRTAHTQALKDNRTRLIIVLLGDVTDDDGMDAELRAYLSTNTYIRRGDPRFWNKLRYALPHRQRNEKRLRAAGEAVMRRVRPEDPPTVLRTDPALEMLAIAPAEDSEKL